MSRSLVISCVLVFSATLAAGLPAAATPVPPPAPTSGWLFDDGDGTTAVDSWDLRHGTLEGGMGTANWVTDTPFTYPGNYCLTFDGLNDRVKVSLGQIIAPEANCTVSAWFRWTDTAPKKEYVIYGERDECQYNIFAVSVEDRMAVPNGTTFAIFDRAPMSVCGTGAWGRHYDPGLPSAGDWHHVVAIHKDDDELQLFLDGVPVLPTVTGAGSYHGGAGATTIGHAHTAAYDAYFAGEIDEVGVWRTALTEDNVAWLHEHSLAEVQLGVPVRRPSSGRAALTAHPTPYRGGDLRIVYAAPLDGTTRAGALVVTDLNGRVVRVIADRVPGEGSRTFSWDGTDATGRPVPPGIFFVATGERGARSSVKLVVLR
jgi:hypothetical protein